MKMDKQQADSVAVGYRRLIAAIVHQAVKDGAVWFLESEKGKSYCAACGVKPDKLHNPPRRGTA